MYDFRLSNTPHPFYMKLHKAILTKLLRILFFYIADIILIHYFPLHQNHLCAILKIQRKTIDSFHTIKR